MDADFILIHKIKQGDEKAFNEFVGKYYGQILKYCRWHCFDEEEAKDLTQETFVRFMAGLSSYRHSGKAKNYLYTIAGNLCKNYYKKPMEILTQDGQIMENGAAAQGPEEDITDKVLLEWAIGKLPRDLSEVVILYYFQGLLMWEIAKVLGIGLPLVKYRLRQARNLLKKFIEMEDGKNESGSDVRKIQ